jgi:chromosome segregation ATPase
MATEEQKMPERISAPPAWAWIVGAVLVIVSIFIGYRIVQTQQHLAATQSELQSAKQAAEKANAERKALQTKLDDATSKAKSAQSQLAGTQSRLEATQRELESAKLAADQAKAQVAELEQRAASLNSELQKSDGQRIELQAKLDEAGSEIERLKSELDQAQRAESP